MSMREIENIKQCFIEHLDPLRIYLFGSSANGTDTAASDLDFYIVVRNNASDLADIAARAYRSIRTVKERPVDIVVGAVSRFEARKDFPSVEHEVFTQGVLLYESGNKGVA